jgi:hypothetical protein
MDLKCIGSPRVKTRINKYNQRNPGNTPTFSERLKKLISQVRRRIGKPNTNTHFHRPGPEPLTTLGTNAQRTANNKTTSRNAIRPPRISLTDLRRIVSSS